MMPAQMKAFFDGTGGLVGQETTHFTALTQLVHHGMVYVPLG
jgi:multimeric flavodoxin WrbA